jgi:hypothetical protein
MHLFEDLAAIARSSKLLDRIARHERVVNAQNLRRGVQARRGDGTFGQIIPGVEPVSDSGFKVARGSIATVEVGVEVKVLAKAMIKQIDRVIGDLRRQVDEFRRGGGQPICVGIVGVNFAKQYTSYEGRRIFRTTGKDGFLHPYQEASEAERRLAHEAKPAFDEFLTLRFKATNIKPYPFEWINEPGLRLDYAASLTRVSALYEQRF